MIRTVWLGLSFLVILAGVGSFRIAFGHFDVANASGTTRMEGEVTAEIRSFQEAFAKSDQSTIEHVAPATHAEFAPGNEAHAELVPQTPAEIATSRINSRHWHEGAAPVIRQARNQKPKRKLTKSVAIADKSEAAVEPKACQLADFEALRAALNLPTGCRI